MPLSTSPRTRGTSTRNNQAAIAGAQEPVTLTRKELEVLAWGAQDKSSWEISQIMACTEATVNFHFANIRRKFQVYSRGAAVHKALRMGLLEL